MGKSSLLPDSTRSKRIAEAIKRAGISALVSSTGLTSWAIYKWAKKGHIPNDRLKMFCKMTGEQPHLVCEPCIAELLRPVKRNSK